MTKGKLRISILLALGLAMLPGAAFAAPELKIGVVDMQRALASSRAGIAAQKQYESEVKEAQAKLDSKKEEFEKLQQGFSKQKDSLNEKARSHREEELIGMEKDLKRNFQDTQETLRRRNAQLVGDLVKKIKVVVDDLGKSEGYTVILEKNANSILFSSSTNDVTDEIVERFNKSAK